MGTLLDMTPVLWDLAWEPASPNLAWDSVLACCLACSCSLMFLGSCSGQHEQPVLGNLAWEPVLGTFLETLAAEPCLTTLSIVKSLACESVIESLALGP